MGISLDLYDFFAHLIPGGFFLMAFLYGFQENWLRSYAFSQLTTAQLVGLAILSYVLGYLIDPWSNRWYKLFKPTHSYGMALQAAESLCRDYPWMKIDPQQASNWYVLLAYIKRHNLPMAQETERFNVTHIMLRGISLGCLFFAIVFGFKIIAGAHVLAYVLLSLFSMAASYGLIKEAIKFRIWFYKSIYQSVLALKMEPDQLSVSYQAPR